MEFFNKKEEVIDLKLTQYGRQLLAKGKLKPVFYSFFDDNVIYDSEKTGLTELQNDTEERIIEAPVLHPQISFSSLEKNFNNSYNKILAGDLDVYEDGLQRDAEKHYALPQPIGTSDVNAEYAPSWSVNFLNGKLSGSVSYLNLIEKTSGANTQKIPQLTSEVEVKVLELSQEDEEILEEYEDSLADSNIAIVSDEEDLFVLLKVSENNGLFQKKNFDIEIFEIEEEIQNGKTIETLRPLKFSKPAEVTTDTSFLDEVLPEDDVSVVDYYFDILVDEEINDEILCQFDPVNEKMGHFSDPRTKLCQDVINKQKKKVFDIYKDESDYPGEIC